MKLVGITDAIAAGGWKVLVGVAIISLVIAIRNTPEIRKAIKEKTGRGRVWPWTNFVLHWSVPILTTLAAISSQLGSHKAERQITSLRGSVTNLSAELGAERNRVAELEAAVQPGPLPVRILRVLKKINPQTEEVLRAHPEGLFANGPILEARVDELEALAREDFTETYFRFSRTTEEAGMSTRGLVIPVHMKLKPALTNWFGYEKGLKRSPASTTSAGP